MMRLTTLAIFLSLLALVSAGCSDLGKSDVVKKPIESTRFNAGCELNIDEFHFILERDISRQINCLEKNIELFMRVVETPRPGYLSRTAFEEYVRRNVEDFKPENIRAIKSVFDIAHLIFGDDRAFLAPSSVKKIFNFVRVVNKEMPKVFGYFQDENDTPFNYHLIQRVRVYQAADTISRALLDIYQQDRGDQVHRVNIIEIVESFIKEGSQDTLDKVKAVMFIKRVVLGGKKDELNHLELQDLLYKFAPAGSVVFDIVRVKHINFDQDENDPTNSGQRSMMEFLLSNIESFERLLYYTADSGERLFNIDDVIDAIPYFLTDADDFPDLKKYREEVLQLKMILMSDARWNEDEDLRGKDWILPGDMRILVDHAKDLARRGAIFHRIYEHFKPYLNSPGPVSINYNNYILQFPGHKSYVEEFARISNNYRFFWGTSELPYYTQAFRRNADGMVQIGLLEYALSIVARRFGTQVDGGVGGYGMSQDQMLGVINKVFGRMLIEEGIILEGRQAKTNENITLLSTLFQPQSNGDGIINVDEGTSFFIQVLASMDMAEWFRTEMANECDTDHKGRITDIQCHRNNYFKILSKRFKAQFPLLLCQLGVEKCENPKFEVKDEAYRNNYLKEIERVARTCTHFKDGTDVPLSKDDYMPIMVMLMTIEGAILRYDVNKNNKLDPSEVKTAYDKTYKIAIEALVEEQAAIIAKLPFNLGSAISKKIYYYLIKHKSLPKKVGDYLKLLTIGATSADRDTFAAVLNIISEQGEPSTFDCDTLR